jgi:hypothetical protein
MVWIKKLDNGYVNMDQVKEIHVFNHKDSGFCVAAYMGIEEPNIILTWNETEKEAHSAAFEISLRLNE